MRTLRILLLGILVPGLLFCAVSGSRGGLCLDAYEWSSEVGYRPVPVSCEPETRTNVFAAAGFYGRATGGFLLGSSGRSREDAATPMARLLLVRLGRSAAIVGVAVTFLGLLATLMQLPLVRTGGRKRGRVTPPWVPPLPGGLPLPIAGYLLFVIIVRTLPPGHPLDYDRAGILWAGIALALADGVGRALFDGTGAALQRELSRPYADNLQLLGHDPRPAVCEVSAPVRAAQLRGALLALLGGLLVVEGFFGINGIGETLRDIVVDRQGLDPLLLTGTLLVFSACVVVVELLPIEVLTRRWFG